MAGPEMTPFILPRRWTFETPKSCVQDYMTDNNGDISALIDEYPFRYPSGKKKPEKCIMYLAADVEDKGKPVAMRVIFFWDW